MGPDCSFICFLLLIMTMNQKSFTSYMIETNQKPGLVQHGFTQHCCQRSSDVTLSIKHSLYSNPSQLYFDPSQLYFVIITNQIIRYFNCHSIGTCRSTKIITGRPSKYLSSIHPISELSQTFNFLLLDVSTNFLNLEPTFTKSIHLI